MRDINRALPATTLCCVAVVGTALLFENSIFSWVVALALCIGSLSYGTSMSGPRIKTARFFLLNAGLLALLVALLRVILSNARSFRMDFLGPWPHRIYRVWSLSESLSIILALVAAGLVTIEVVGKMGGYAMRKRFQWSIMAVASVTAAANIAHFLRPVLCADFFSLTDFHSHCSRKEGTAEEEDLCGPASLRMLR